MQKKRSFNESFEAFFAGKGFYIVLFLCVAVIGVSAWVIMAGTGTDVDNEPFVDVMLAPEENIIAVTKKPEAPVIAVPEASAPTMAEEPIAEVSVTEEPPEVWSPAENEPQTPMYVWPVHGDITAEHSVDALVYNRTMQDWRTHDGIDIAAEQGTQVLAVSAGVVENIYQDDLFGTTIVISHTNGVRTVYSNMAELPTVIIGDSVSPGEIIGAVGNTALAETAEASHLHLAMTVDGESVNPREYLP